jgi:hypothetical protein
MKWSTWCASVAGLAALTSCTSPAAEARRERDEFNRELRSVRLEDGVDQHEAALLARGYFWNFTSGCGGTGRTLDRGAHWETETYVGYAALPGAPILVQKESGASRGQEEGPP